MGPGSNLREWLGGREVEHGQSDLVEIVKGELNHRRASDGSARASAENRATIPVRTAIPALTLGQHDPSMSLTVVFREERSRAIVQERRVTRRRGIATHLPRHVIDKNMQMSCRDEIHSRLAVQDKSRHFERRYSGRDGVTRPWL